MSVFTLMTSCMEWIFFFIHNVIPFEFCCELQLLLLKKDSLQQSVVKTFWPMEKKGWLAHILNREILKILFPTALATKTKCFVDGILLRQITKKKIILSHLKNFFFAFICYFGHCVFKPLNCRTTVYHIGSYYIDYNTITDLVRLVP